MQSRVPRDIQLTRPSVRCRFPGLVRDVIPEKHQNLKVLFAKMLQQISDQHQLQDKVEVTMRPQTMHRTLGPVLLEFTNAPHRHEVAHEKSEVLRPLGAAATTVNSHHPAVECHQGAPEDLVCLCILMPRDKTRFKR
jgi:hypothetical protein